MYENTGNSIFILKKIHFIENTAGVYLANREDYNSDGFDDFSYIQCFWSGCTDSLYVELNDHDWSFETAQQYFIGTLNSFRINSIDLNGDHFPDFYMTGYNSNKTVKILWNNGDGTFSYENPVGTEESPKHSRLSISASPNPFSDQVKITVNAEKGADLNVVVYDILGRRVKGLHPLGWSPYFDLTWNGHDDCGIECPVGLYLVVAEGDDCRIITKVVKSER